MTKMECNRCGAEFPDSDVEFGLNLSKKRERNLAKKWCIFIHILRDKCF